VVKPMNPLQSDMTLLVTQWVHWTDFRKPTYN